MLRNSFGRIITATISLVALAGVIIPAAASANDLTVSGTLNGNIINASLIQGADFRGTGVFATTGTLNGNDIQTNTIWSSTGMTTGGTITVGSGGLHVVAGGLTVDGGGATINAGTLTLGSLTGAPVHLDSAQTTSPTGVASITGIPSVTVTGTDVAGYVILNGTPSATGVATITYNHPYSGSTAVVVISPNNASAVAANAYVSFGGSLNNFTITTTAATPGATPEWSYHVIQIF